MFEITRSGPPLAHQIVKVMRSDEFTRDFCEWRMINRLQPECAHHLPGDTFRVCFLLITATPIFTSLAIYFIGQSSGERHAIGESTVLV